MRCYGLKTLIYKAAENMHASIYWNLLRWWKLYVDCTRSARNCHRSIRSWHMA